MRIQKLSDEVVNQIAAGEVVERPAHMVKELVENSIDAGSTELTIDLNEGGRYVRIADNGKGMPADDLELAVQRHATSKISKTDDIWNVDSFGFRGEALASIAAVSQMKIFSRTEKAEGSELNIDFGKIGKTKSAAGEQGTTITVDQLFKNVPARMKFLKSDPAEMTQIKIALRALAMAHPHVSFRIRHKDKLLFFWPGTESLKERVENVLEHEKLHETALELGRFKMRAIISSPNNVVHQARQIWVFVRGRHVQDRNLQHAVLEAYRGLLMHGEYPISAVFVECPPTEVDVNIHPTKSQVKFRDRQNAFRVVHRGIREILEKAPWVESVVGQPVQQPAMPVYEPPVQQADFVQPEFQRTQFNTRTFDQPVTENVQAPVTPTVENPKWSNLQVLSQANHTYILTQNAGALVLVDQHAAHERVIYESLMRDWKAKKTEVQSLLIPMTLDLTEEAVISLRPFLPEFAEFGLELEEMGPSVLAVRSIPSIIKEDSLVHAIRKMADEIEERGDSFSLEKAVSEVFASMACHSAIRAGQPQSIEQMKSLLQQMDEFPLSSFCPHGRPVFVEMSFDELERRFGRIV